MYDFRQTLFYNKLKIISTLNLQVGAHILSDIYASMTSFPFHSKELEKTVLVSCSAHENHFTLQ